MIRRISFLETEIGILSDLVQHIEHDADLLPEDPLSMATIDRIKVKTKMIRDIIVEKGSIEKEKVNAEIER